MGEHWMVVEIRENGLCAMRIDVEIANFGNGRAGEFWAAIFYADLLVVKKRIAGLAVDEIVTIGGSVTVPQGHYDTVTIIDWHNLVPEWDEENNDDIDGRDCDPFPFAD
jgi:subtilase family serine protease